MSLLSAFETLSHSFFSLCCSFDIDCSVCMRLFHTCLNFAMSSAPCQALIVTVASIRDSLIGVSIRLGFPTDAIAVVPHLIVGMWLRVSVLVWSLYAGSVFRSAVF